MAWKLTTVVLEEQAFIMMVTAALEVYPKETFGILVGKQRKHKARIENAYPYQTAVRKIDEVSLWPKNEMKIRQILGEMTQLKVIGDFHSHALWPNYLSDADIEYMLEDGERICVLMVINPSKKPVPWKYDPKTKAIIGSFGTDLISIKFYGREYQSRLIKKLKIECPFMKKLNKMHVDKLELK